MATSKIKGLQMWCKARTDGYRDVEVRNMAASWRDGLAFCAIIHRFRPDIIDYDSLSKENAFENNDLAFRVAETELGIPALLEAADMVAMKVPDKLSVITYVAQFHNYFKDKPQLGGPGVQTGKPQSVAVKRPNQATPAAPAPKIANLSDNGVEQEKVISRITSIGDTCTICKNKVFLLERQIEGHKLYHRSCFRSSEMSPANKVYARPCDLGIQPRSRELSAIGSENVKSNTSHLTSVFESTETRDGNKMLVDEKVAHDGKHKPVSVKEDIKFPNSCDSNAKLKTKSDDDVSDVLRRIKQKKFSKIETDMGDKDSDSYSSKQRPFTPKRPEKLNNNDSRSTEIVASSKNAVTDVIVEDKTNKHDSKFHTTHTAAHNLKQNVDVESEVTERNKMSCPKPKPRTIVQKVEVDDKSTTKHSTTTSAMSNGADIQGVTVKVGLLKSLANIRGRDDNTTTKRSSVDADKLTDAREKTAPKLKQVEKREQKPDVKNQSDVNDRRNNELEWQKVTLKKSEQTQGEKQTEDSRTEVTSVPAKLTDSEIKSNKVTLPPRPKVRNIPVKENTELDWQMEARKRADARGGKYVDPEKVGVDNKDKLPPKRAIRSTELIVNTPAKPPRTYEVDELSLSGKTTPSKIDNTQNGHFQNIKKFSENKTVKIHDTNSNFTSLDQSTQPKPKKKKVPTATLR